MLEMAYKEILPAAESYQKELCTAALRKTELLDGSYCNTEKALVKKLSTETAEMYKHIATLEQALETVKTLQDAQEKADFCHDTVFAEMQALRTCADELEVATAKKYWPYPTYSDLLFGVK